MRRAGVLRWWITAIEMAKSNVWQGWGRERVSATTVEWGEWWDAILMRFVDLGDMLDYD